MRTLLEAEGPLSSQQIEMSLESVDRSSISRALTLFSERGVVHSVDDGSGSVKYEACRSCDGHHHDDDHHPHFHCLGCGATICLSDEAIPPVALPAGYIPHTTNYVVKGYCPKCHAKIPRH